MYTDYAIYSPEVPVFRDDDGTLLEEPYSCSFITCPAVYAKGLRRYDPGRLDEVPAVMRERILKVLAVAARHGHENLIVGDWGCGAFGNDSRVIAPLFKEALTDQFRGVFSLVVFAITDWSPERRFIGPFEEVFGAA